MLSLNLDEHCIIPEGDDSVPEQVKAALNVTLSEMDIAGDDVPVELHSAAVWCSIAASAFHKEHKCDADAPEQLTMEDIAERTGFNAWMEKKAQRGFN